MIYLNGKETDFCPSIMELLDKNGYRKDRIAVEINGEIIKRSRYDNTMLNDGDRVEIVCFMGGG